MRQKQDYNWHCEACLEGFPPGTTQRDIETHSTERHDGEEVAIGILIVCPRCNSVMRKTSDGKLMAYICPQDLQIRLVEKADTIIK